MHNPPEASAPWCLVVTLAVIIEVKCSRTTEQDHPTINYTKVTELIIKCRVPHKECRCNGDMCSPDFLFPRTHIPGHAPGDMCSP